MITFSGGTSLKILVGFFILKNDHLNYSNLNVKLTKKMDENTDS
jgi:hypothetical protein